MPVVVPVSNNLPRHLFRASRVGSPPTNCLLGKWFKFIIMLILNAQHIVFLYYLIIGNMYTSFFCHAFVKDGMYHSIPDIKLTSE